MVNDAILQNIQTDNTWVDVETVAFLKNISKRGVRLSLKSNSRNFSSCKTIPTSARSRSNSKTKQALLEFKSITQNKTEHQQS